MVRISQATEASGNIKNYVITGLKWPLAEDASAKVYEYFSVFNEKDTQKIANEIYATPLHIGGATGHLANADPSRISRIYTLPRLRGFR